MKTKVFLRLLLTGIVMAAGTRCMAGVRVNCLMDGTNHVFEDDNVCLSLVVQPDGYAELHLYNKTTAPLVVDRTRSFAYVNDESYTLFVPSAHTESHTESVGVVNMERFPHAGHYQAGSYSDISHTSIHTEWDRPLQRVAPRGRAVIYVFPQLPELIDGRRMDIGRRGHALRFGRRGRFIDPATGRRIKFRRGDEALFTEGNTPLSLSAYVNYALDDVPAAGATHVAQVSDFIRQVNIGGNMAQTMGHFSFVSGGGNGWLATEIGMVAAAAVVFGTTLGNMDMSMPDFPF